MNTVRKTVTLPSGLALMLEREAEKRGMSLSSLIAEKLAAREDARLSISGILHDEDPDLSLKIEEILQRAFRDGA